jgi:putative membrane protein
MSHASESEQGHTHTDSVLDILKKRYARGEIRKEEFEEKKKDLV